MQTIQVLVDARSSEDAFKRVSDALTEAWGVLERHGVEVWGGDEPELAVDAKWVTENEVVAAEEQRSRKLRKFFDR